MAPLLACSVALEGVLKHEVVAFHPEGFVLHTKERLFQGQAAKRSSKQNVTLLAQKVKLDAQELLKLQQASGTYSGLRSCVIFVNIQSQPACTARQKAQQKLPDYV